MIYCIRFVQMCAIECATQNVLYKPFKHWAGKYYWWEHLEHKSIWFIWHLLLVHIWAANSIPSNLTDWLEWINWVNGFECSTQTYIVLVTLVSNVVLWFFIESQFQNINKMTIRSDNVLCNSYSTSSNHNDRSWSRCCLDLRLVLFVTLEFLFKCSKSMIYWYKRYPMLKFLNRYLVHLMNREWALTMKMIWYDPLLQCNIYIFKWKNTLQWS